MTNGHVVGRQRKAVTMIKRVVRSEYTTHVLERRDLSLNITNLEKCFYEASHQDKKYVGVKVEMFGFKDDEIIINPNINFDKKFEYYKNAYNEDLTLKNAPDKIRLTGFTYGDSFEDIENDLKGAI